MFFLLFAFLAWLCLWLVIGAAAGAIGLLMGHWLYSNEPNKKQKTIWSIISWAASAMICFLCLTIGSVAHSIFDPTQEAPYWYWAAFALIPLIFCILLFRFLMKKFCR